MVEKANFFLLSCFSRVGALVAIRIEERQRCRDVEMSTFSWRRRKSLNRSIPVHCAPTCCALQDELQDWKTKTKNIKPDICHQPVTSTLILVVNKKIPKIKFYSYLSSTFYFLLFPHWQGDKSQEPKGRGNI